MRTSRGLGDSVPTHNILFQFLPLPPRVARIGFDRHLANEDDRRNNIERRIRPRTQKEVRTCCLTLSLLSSSFCSSGFKPITSAFESGVTSIGAPAELPPAGPLTLLPFRFLCEVPPATDRRARALYRSRFRSMGVEGGEGDEGKLGAGNDRATVILRKM